MKFSNRTVQAAHALAMSGCVETQVGDPDGLGAAWQAIVRLERGLLLTHEVSDIHYPWVKPGTSTLVWLVLDDDTVICHQSEDLDKKGGAERAAAMLASFAEVTQFYNEPLQLDGFNFGTDLSDFDFGEEVKDDRQASA